MKRFWLKLFNSFGIKRAGDLGYRTAKYVFAANTVRRLLEAFESSETQPENGILIYVN
ncbi:hypothetical protein [Acetivibrio straminisolvens]|uniref:hypothetical protein n=1 Tax=Acetivibrio straminisolvens TaxID=253314 RepID=UPI00138ACEC6|nr:hypothetical protein [Acetivibrio straminisolvens]